MDSHSSFLTKQLERCWRQGKSVCVNKGNLLRAQTSNKKLQLRKVKAPTNSWLEKCTVLDRQSSFWQDPIQHERSPDLAETFSNEVTSAWQNRQETDFKRFCGFVFAFAFSLRPASTNGTVLTSILLLITVVANTSARFALAKGQELLRLFFDYMG